MKKLEDVNEDTNLNSFNQAKFKKDSENVQIIYKKIITLINNTYSYMLGPEKNRTATFISQNYENIYEILKMCKKNHNSTDLGGQL
ncbi:MAG: hypothetical protein GF311_09065 [Candidatus Lokiarchaeota archaeon]|nr:hypothetical protein [Candidatus Lokiarchaeota archaeon]